MKKFFRNHGLILTMLLLFVLSVGGHFIAGFRAYNEDRIENHEAPLTSMLEYADTGHFISSIGENWESEFLQMAIFIWFTAFLFQKGSSESHPLPEDETAQDKKDDETEEAYTKKQRKKYPVLWRLYENSMVLILTLLFILSFAVHQYGSMRQLNEERAVYAEPAITFWQVLGESKFWFESFQNWQSEFLSIAAIVFLGIYFRQKDSAQSKRMNSGHDETE